MTTRKDIDLEISCLAIHLTLGNRLRILHVIKMLHRHRHIIVFLLLFSYLLLGAVGCIESLILSGFGTNPQIITQSKSGPPTTTKVYWTQYKHIPSTVKLSVPSPAVFAPPATPRVCICGITFTQVEFSILLDPSFSLHSSRAPPQV
jgi:hypothetical protein